MICEKEFERLIRCAHMLSDHLYPDELTIEEVLKMLMSNGQRVSVPRMEYELVDFSLFSKLMIPILINEGMIRSQEEFEGFMIGVDVAEKLFPMSNEREEMEK